VLGHVLLSIGAVPQVGLDLRSVLDFSGLFVIALSTGFFPKIKKIIINYYIKFPKIREKCKPLKKVIY
jgi:hypothetical protein